MLTDQQIQTVSKNLDIISRFLKHQKKAFYDEFYKTNLHRFQQNGKINCREYAAVTREANTAWPAKEAGIFKKINHIPHQATTETPPPANR